MDINMDMDIEILCNNVRSGEFNIDNDYNNNNWTYLDNDIYIFTDGSYRNNKDKFNSGLGIFLGLNALNIKVQYENKTGNYCELLAIYYTLNIIIKYLDNLIVLNKSINIVSDSEYAIKSITLWIFKWINNGWKTSTGKEIKNLELIKNIYDKLKFINDRIKINFIHINSHKSKELYANNKRNIYMWKGNFIADKLAQNLI